jgi:DNA-binding response OmpR family regulator
MEAVTAEAALACVRRDRPDLMLLDVALPGMNGLEVLRRVRRDAPTVRIIMVTGLDDEALARSTLQMGAVDSVRVPFDFEHLDRAVRAAVVTH